jgi:dirigent-like protein
MMLALKHVDHIRASPDKTAGPAPMCPAGRLLTVGETTCKEAIMHAQTTKQARVNGPGRTRTRWAPASAAAVALVAAGIAGAAAAPAASAAPARSPGAATTRTFYAFDINNGTTDPGFIPVPGTNPSVFAQGDELIVNDQLTTTHKVNGGYPIVGHDAGVCTLTRIPEPHAAQTLADCAATAVLPGGSLTIQGVLAFRAQQPQPAVLAVTGGTGRFADAAGTVAVTFTKNFKILTIKLT